MDRLSYIAQLALQNEVDVVCLQEVPRQSLGDNPQFGLIPQGSPVYTTLQNVAGFFNSYRTIQARAEDNPNGPNFANTADGYLIMYRRAMFPGGHQNFGYYQAAQFFNPTPVFLRPPVQVTLRDNNGAALNVLNWHAQADGASASWSLQILNGLVGNGANRPIPTVIAGDFNIRGNFETVFPGQNFPNWTNAFANYPGPNGQLAFGLDHILTSNLHTNTIMGNVLQFRSDAYHYPIAVDM